MTKQSRHGLALALIVLGAACAHESSPEVTGKDLDEMKHASRAYMEAWLSNDPEVVMATFVAEPVLSPFRRAFLEGQQAARGFWWPDDAAPSTVTAFDYDELEVRGSGDLGFIRGNFTLVFDYNGTTYRSRGTYVHILTRTPDRGWRISHRFWNDLQREPA